MDRRLSRRAFAGGVLGAGIALIGRDSRAAGEPAWSYPIARAGGIPGDGFFIRHGFGCENATYYPGLAHTGENWYGVAENAAGAPVLAAADGEVVYADYDYPGHVVIVAHAGGLYSVYGHLDYELAVGVGDAVVRGQALGTVLARTDEYERSHLHFEIRTFLIEDIVNGDHPSYGFTCGYQCPPGPGYWPLDAPEHPADLGWLNPTHVIARRARAGDMTIVVPSDPGSDRLPTWDDLPWRAGSRRLDDLPVAPGDRFRVAEVKAGTETARGRNARGYRLWHRLERPSGELAWVEALTPDAADRNHDGAPSGIRFNLLPAVEPNDD